MQGPLRRSLPSLLSSEWGFSGSPRPGAWALERDSPAAGSLLGCRRQLVRVCFHWVSVLTQSSKKQMLG